MQPFRLLEHTADVGFEAWGSTPAEVFRNSARALMDIIVDLASVRPESAVPVSAQGHGFDSLLVNWLSEILYLEDAEGWLFHDFEIEPLTEHTIRGTARGERFDRERHRIKLLVKAVTYHQLAFERQPGVGWRAQVYVDI